jgi:hypothetical protein
MNKLDLHGVRHIDVTNTVKRFIEDNWDAGEPVEVITGQSPAMRVLVAEVVEEYNLSIEKSFLSGCTNVKPSMIIKF